MTDLLKRSTTQTVLWWPVILRGGLYLVIATMTAALSEMDSITAEELANMSVFEWSKSALTVAIVGLTTLRTFIDNSVGVHAEKLANDENQNPNSALPGAS